MNVYESKDIEGWGQVCGGGAPHIDRSTRKRGPRDAAVTVLSGGPSEETGYGSVRKKIL